jgi:hypothetical protein
MCAMRRFTRTSIGRSDVERYGGRYLRAAEVTPLAIAWHPNG